MRKLYFQHLLSFYGPLIYKGILLSKEDFLIGLTKDHPWMLSDHLIPITTTIWDDLHHFLFLKSWILDPEVEELVIENNGSCLIKKPFFSISFHLLFPDDVISMIFHITCLQHQQMWNLERPFHSFYILLYERSLRFSFFHQCLTPQKNHKLFIRTQRISLLSWDDFGGSLSLKEKIKNILLEKSNLFIIGASGSGKTGLLNFLLTWLPQDEHLIILEETHELSPPKHITQVTHFLQKHSGITSGIAKDQTLVHFCEYALRISPDRFVLGELRHQEIQALLLLLNNGHKGFISTFHASHPQEALQRLTLIASMKNNIEWDTLMEFFTQHMDYILHIENKKILSLFRIEGHFQGKVRGSYLWKKT